MPFPIRMAGLQKRNCICDPLRAFGMAGARIFCAARIVEDNHSLHNRRKLLRIKGLAGWKLHGESVG